MTTTMRKALEITALAVVPIVALVLGLSTFADQNRLALDFHEEVYPQAEAVVDGDPPYPAPDTPITDTTNAIWPMAAVLPAIPLTALSPGAADWIATASCSHRFSPRSGCSRFATGASTASRSSGRR